MSFFEDIKNKLFPGNRSVSIHEVLKRSHAFQNEYKSWKDSEHYRDLMKDLYSSYNFKISDLKPKYDVEVYNSSYSNGLTIFNNTPSINHMDFLMENFLETLRSERYRLVHADRKIDEKPKKIETIEKYYCKPPISHHTPIDQLYGNIIIELYIYNHKFNRLKLLANIYSDRLYNLPRDFNDLVKELFKTENI